MADEARKARLLQETAQLMAFRGECEKELENRIDSNMIEGKHSPPALAALLKVMYAEMLRDIDTLASDPPEDATRDSIVFYISMHQLNMAYEVGRKAERAGILLSPCGCGSESV
jgi:hypothetical protein